MCLCHISMKVTAGSAFLSLLEKVKRKYEKGDFLSSERRQIIKCSLILYLSRDEYKNSCFKYR